MVLLLSGAKESARANAVMVAVKIGTLVLFCAIAFGAVRARNFSPFLPLGLAGMSAGGAKVFFSYIGFDAASTAGEEAKNPQRDLPRAILLSLGVVTALYCLVAVAAVGALPWQQFDGQEAALSHVLSVVSGSELWAALLAVGALVAISSVVLTVLYGQTRILFAMSRDGLVPKRLSTVDARTGAPRTNTLVVSGFVAVLAAFIPLGKLADATSIGTLFAFGLVNIAVLLLRRREPATPRTFRVPFSPATPILGVLCCGYLMLSLDGATWVVFGGWMALGLVLYFGYGVRRSRLARA
jgi:APA family basic amino acid/polyamine antiporter